MTVEVAAVLGLSPPHVAGAASGLGQGGLAACRTGIQSGPGLPIGGNLSAIYRQFIGNARQGNPFMTRPADTEDRLAGQPASGLFAEPGWQVAGAAQPLMDRLP